MVPHLILPYQGRDGVCNASKRLNFIYVLRGNGNIGLVGISTGPKRADILGEGRVNTCRIYGCVDWRNKIRGWDQSEGDDEASG